MPTTTTTTTANEPSPSSFPQSKPQPLLYHFLHPRPLLFLPILTGLILTIIASPPHFNNRVSDDGLGSAVCVFALCAFGVSLFCELGLLSVPWIAALAGGGAGWPFRHRGQAEAENGDGNGNGNRRRKMHPALPLSIEAVAFAVATALAGLNAYFVSLVSVEGLFYGVVACQFVTVVGHAVLVGLEVREVVRLRREQKRKRSSLKAGSGEEGLQGWVELEAGTAGRGAGGGLGGKGGGL